MFYVVLGAIFRIQKPYWVLKQKQITAVNPGDIFVQHRYAVIFLVIQSATETIKGQINKQLT